MTASIAPTGMRTAAAAANACAGRARSMRPTGDDSLQPVHPVPGRCQVALSCGPPWARPARRATAIKSYTVLRSSWAAATAAPPSSQPASRSRRAGLADCDHRRSIDQVLVEGARSAPAAPSAAAAPVTAAPATAAPYRPLFRRLMLHMHETT